VPFANDPEKNTNLTRRAPRIIRLAGIAVCLIAIVIALVLATSVVLRIGQARALVVSSLSSGSLAVADEAVRLSPGDPDAYARRAAILAKRDEPLLAVDDLRQAIAFRPRDYRLWTELGITLERAGNSQAALVALAEARRLAPLYARPHWETGLLLNKLGRQGEALAEFRHATSSQPSLLPKVIDFAWQHFSGNCELIQRAIEPDTNYERLLLAFFFIRKDKPGEALSLIRQINNLTAHDRRQLLNEFLRAEQFTEAHELWADSLGISAESRAGRVIYDGGFESLRLEDETGFGWRVNRNSGVQISLDRNAKDDHNQSLRIDWQGSPDASDVVISQLVVVAPNTTYQLNFAVRAQELITGGAPVITVTSAHQADSGKLAQSTGLPLGTTGWQAHSVGFTTTNATRAIRISLQRENCAEPRCPIFGSLWLDDFSLIQAPSVRYQPRMNADNRGFAWSGNGKNYQPRMNADNRGFAWSRKGNY